MVVISAAERHQSVAQGVSQATRAEQFSPRGAKEKFPSREKGYCNNAEAFRRPSGARARFAVTHGLRCGLHSWRRSAANTASHFQSMKTGAFIGWGRPIQAFRWFEWAAESFSAAGAGTVKLTALLRGATLLLII